MKHFTLLALLLAAFSMINAQSIYDIQGQQADSPYKDQVVTTKGIVTAIYSGSYFIQDGDSAWTGLYIYDNTNSPVLGDSLELTGTIVEYYGMTEMKDVTTFNTASTGNTVPDPIVIETGDAQEKWESVFLAVKKAACTNTDLGYGEWEVNDGSGTLVVNDLGITYSPILGVEYAITGPLDFSFDFFKIEPRTMDDIVQDLNLYFKTNPYAENIAKTSFDISWETNDEASAYIEYGLTTDFELGKLNSTVSTTLHSISLSDLTPATIYQTKCYSVNANKDTTPIYYGTYVTQSESSGKINSYFNHNEFVMLKKNGFTDNIVDTIISYIGMAQSTLDVTMYDLTNHAPQSDSSNYKLIQAINKAYTNGVAVRFISDDSPSNNALDSLDSNIPLVRGNSNGIMHNKFLIIDANSTDNAWVLTGSTNWTYNNLFMDFNNVMCIQDQSLAKAYEIEFNEMWGSNTLTPDAAKAKFGNEKSDNTPHQFNINGTAVDLYFSPSDKTTSKIVKAIDNATNSIDFAMMVFTENQLGNAIVNAHKRGVNTGGFIDYVEYSGSEFDYLKDNGVEVVDFVNASGESWPTDKTLHHKFCIIDNGGANPVLVNGTHNWSASAESKNDENTLLIYSQELVDKFQLEIEQINLYLGDISVKENIGTSNINVFPNPSKGSVKVSIENYTGESTITIYTISGSKLSSTVVNENSYQIKLNKAGLYFIEVVNSNYREVQKIIIE